MLDIKPTSQRGGRPSEVALAAMKPLPASLQKHSLDGETCHTGVVAQRRLGKLHISDNCCVRCELAAFARYPTPSNCHLRGWGISFLRHAGDTWFLCIGLHVATVV